MYVCYVLKKFKIKTDFFFQYLLHTHSFSRILKSGLERIIEI